MVKAESLFRIATEEEERIIESFLLSEFESEIKEAIAKKSFFVKQRGVKEVYILSKELNDVIELIHTNSPDLFRAIFFAGYPIGIILKNQFQLEITGGYYFNKYIRKKLIVKTQQFLYGKDIVIANVKSYTSPFKEGDWVAVYGSEKNGSELFYGVGKVLCSSSELPSASPNTLIIKGYKQRPFDLGWYLRFEK